MIDSRRQSAHREFEAGLARTVAEPLVDVGPVEPDLGGAEVNRRGIGSGIRIRPHINRADAGRAVHGVEIDRPAGHRKTEPTRAPASGASSVICGLPAADAGAPSCTTVTAWPAMVTTPVRTAGDGLGSTRTTTLDTPLPLSLATRSQLESATAV